jgi:hypothetical protein
VRREVGVGEHLDQVDPRHPNLASDASTCARTAARSAFGGGPAAVPGATGGARRTPATTRRSRSGSRARWRSCR